MLLLLRYLPLNVCPPRGGCVLSFYNERVGSGLWLSVLTPLLGVFVCPLPGWGVSFLHEG